LSLHDALPILEHQDVVDVRPSSQGGRGAARRQGEVNDDHVGDPALDSADFVDVSGPGNLRVDYVLPSRSLPARGSGVFWPTVDDPLFRLTGDHPFPSSDHRWVRVDVLRPRRGGGPVTPESPAEPSAG